MRDKHNIARPSDAELKLLRALWRGGRQSAREIHDATSPSTAWSYSTTRKLLDRMEEKGLVRVKAVHGVKTFTTARPKLETLAMLIKDFARDVLDARAPIPVAAFAHSKLIAPEEIEELQRLIERFDEASGDDE